MQVFKVFFKVARKYKWSIILYFGICALMTLMVSAQYDRTEGDKTVQYGNESYNIHVTDLDNSELSNAVVDFLKSQHNVNESEYGEDVMKDMLYYQEFQADVTIPEGFGEAAFGDAPKKLNVLADEGQAAGSLINLQIDNYLNSISRFVGGDFDLDTAIRYSNKAAEVSEYVKVRESDGGASDQNSKLYSLFLFLPYAIMSIILATVLPVLLRFQEKDIKDRTDISPISQTGKNLALVLGGMAISLIVCVGLIAFTSIFLNEDVFTRKWVLCGLNVLIFTIVTAMMLVLFNSLSFLGIAKAKDIIVNIVGLSFSFLGGIFVPLSILGDGVKSVGKFLPTYWYATALERIDAGDAMSGIVGAFARQGIFGVICVAVGLIVVAITEKKVKR